MGMEGKRGGGLKELVQGPHKTRHKTAHKTLAQRTTNSILLIILLKDMGKREGHGIL